MSSWIGRLVAVALVIAALVAIGLWLPVAAIVEWMRGLGWLGVLVFAAVFVAVTVPMLPTVELSVAAGLLYGVVWGTVLSTALCVVGELVVLGLGRTRLRGWIEPRLERHRRLGAIDQGLAERSLWIAFLLRLSPVVPYGALNYLLAATRMPLWHRVVANVAGMGPNNLAWAYAGSMVSSPRALAQATEGPPGGAQLALWIGLAVAIAAVALTGWAAHRALEREASTSPRGG